MPDIPLQFDVHEYHPVPSVFRQTIEGVVEAFQSREVIESLNPIDDFYYTKEAVDYSVSQIKKHPASKIYIGPETWTHSYCHWQCSYWDLNIMLYVDDNPALSDIVLDMRAHQKVTVDSRPDDQITYEYYFRFIYLNR